MAVILVVDDLAANREVLVTLLRYKGHLLLEAADGQEALDAVARQRPDLVITDVLMPVMDGYEFVRRLRLDPLTRDIPVAFYTAHYGATEARALALSSGVTDVLIKPVEPEEVLRVVDRLLSGGAKPARRRGEQLPVDFDQAHLRLVTDQLSATARDLGAANARLRALINIGLELASEKEPARLLQTVTEAARDLFAATYVTLGILDRADGTLQRLVTDGIEKPSELRMGHPVNSILHRVISERRVLRGTNPGGDPAALGLPADHPPVHSYLVAPVASPTHVYGWIFLAGNEGRSFSEEDEPLNMALSGQVGRTYENGYYHAVAQSERDRAQRYLDTAQVILLALDNEGRIQLVNQYGCDILGWTSDELLGRDWIETFLPDRMRPAVRKSFNSLILGDLSVIENPVLTRSGEERLIEWRNTVLRDADGKPIGTLSSGTDTTERHRAEEAIRAGEERMRFALQNANVGIWDIDYRDSTLRWSETLEAQYGLEPGSFAGTFDAFIQVIHPDDRASVIATIDAAMKSGRDFTVQNRALWPNGTVRWLSGAGRVMLGDDGEPLRGLGISLDVTERRSLEEQYQQAQKMEAVGRLAGGVAHDFNNLLTAILGYCDLLLSDLDAKDPRRGDITEIQTAGNRAAALTRQLLAFSRKQIIEPTILDLNLIVSGMEGMIKRLIGEDVQVALRLSPGLASVKADKGQVEQVLMNLAVNARDAMPAGGTLTIDTANVELDETHARTHPRVVPGSYVRVTVTDTGTGMTPAVKARLFEPFFTTKEVGKGTGLGLATVYGIVDRCGGSVDVYSELGYGSSFHVYLPSAAGVVKPAEPRAPTPSRHGGATILVVEDEDGLRTLAKRLLEREGYTVLLAANANEAIRLFDQHDSIDVLLTDVIMPGSSGPELTRVLVERKPGLRVVYMSGYTEEAIVHHGVLAPGVTFLHKPFTADTLGGKIREVLES